MADTPERYVCERCGGTGQQGAGLWVQAKRAYCSVAGTCESCGGSGKLGELKRMTTPDTAALLALDAARTPGEWKAFGYIGRGCLHGVRADGFHVIENAGEKDVRAIVAAVNALGPLCRRVQELERTSDQWHHAYSVSKAQLAAANARVAELEAENWRMTDRILAKRASEFWEKEDERSPEGF